METPLLVGAWLKPSGNSGNAFRVRVAKATNSEGDPWFCRLATAAPRIQAPISR